MASMMRLRTAVKVGELSKTHTLGQIAETLGCTPYFVLSIAAQFKIRVTWDGTIPDRIRVYRNRKSGLWTCTRGRRVVAVRDVYADALHTAVRLAESDRKAARDAR